MSLERASGGTSLIDVLDRVLDKGIVVDAWVRQSLVGIDLTTVENRLFLHPVLPLRLWAAVRTGLDGNEDWLMKIAPDGSAEIFTRHPEGRCGHLPFALSIEQRRAIMRAIEAANFFGLSRRVEPKRLRASVDSISLGIKLGERTRTVHVFEPQSVTGREMAGFRRVWNAVSAACLIPPPYHFDWAPAQL
jgi:gas vesicle structural protein